MCKQHLCTITTKRPFCDWYATSTQKNLKIKYTQTWRWMVTKWLMCLWAEITRDHIIYIMNKFVFHPKRHRKCLKKITSVFSSCASFCIVSFSSCFRTKASVNEGSRLKLRTYPSQLQQKKIRKKERKKKEKKKKKKKRKGFCLNVILVIIFPHHYIFHLQANFIPHPNPPNDQYYSE